MTFGDELKILWQVKRDYPNITFESGERFEYSPELKTVYYKHFVVDFVNGLLHEIGHNLAGHTKHYVEVSSIDNTRNPQYLYYSSHTEDQVIGEEWEAWKIAAKLAIKYNHFLKLSYIKENIQSYHEWKNCKPTKIKIESQDKPTRVPINKN
jgi:hypothetical protein